MPIRDGNPSCASWDSRNESSKDFRTVTMTFYKSLLVASERKIFYNLALTSLSIAVALIVGTIELLQVLMRVLDLRGPFFDPIAGLDFGVLGYLIVGTFIAAWGVSVAIWKFARIEERYGHVHLNAHEHEH